MARNRPGSGRYGPPAAHVGAYLLDEQCPEDAANDEDDTANRDDD